MLQLKNWKKPLKMLLIWGKIVRFYWLLYKQLIKDFSRTAKPFLDLLSKPTEFKNNTHKNSIKTMKKNQ